MWIIDRFEGEYAIVECGDINFSLPRKTLPDNVKVGDVIQVEISREKTAEREAHVNSLMNKLFGEKR